MNLNISSIGGNSQNRPNFAEMKAKVDAQLIAAGATQDEIESAGPSGIQALASKYGVSLPQPPQRQQESSSIFDAVNGSNSQSGGMPSMGGTPPSGPPPEIVSALQAGGATADEIAGISGPQDAQSLAAKYGISLPAPPSMPQGNMNTSIFSQ